MMKRFALLCTLALTATLAWAGNAYLGTGYSAVTAPTSSTDGYALAYPKSAKGFTVTVADSRDGSVGDALDSVLNVTATAYCYNPKATVTGGASGWTQFPALDLSLNVLDAGTGIAGTGYHAALQGTTPTTVLGVDCTRIQYVINNLNAQYDGGTSLVTRTTIAEQN